MAQSKVAKSCIFDDEFTSTTIVARTGRISPYLNGRELGQSYGRALRQLHLPHESYWHKGATDVPHLPSLMPVSLKGSPMINKKGRNGMCSEPMKHTVLFTLGLFLPFAAAYPLKAGPPKYDDLSAFLEPLRAKSDLPALAAAVVMSGKIKAVGAVGVRKLGAGVPVTMDDQFHLGSCTKAMTATLIAKLVEDGKLKWDTTPADVFPEFSEGMNEGFRTVTIRHLLSHRAGLPGESAPAGMTLLQVHRLPGPPREQRLEYTRLMLAPPPACTAGSKYIYSNAGYAIAGAMAERVMDKSWETLIAEQVFGPLGITSAGFGAMGTSGKIDQPWQHRMAGGKALSIEPGPLADNPPAIAPAGTVHMNVADWARFVADHVNEGKKRGRLLKRTTYRTLHTAPYGGEYAFGWIVAPRPWAKGDALTHAGSNTMNFAVVWAAPKRGFAVLVMTNIARDDVPARVDEIVFALIQKFLLNR